MKMKLSIETFQFFIKNNKTEKFSNFKYLYTLDDTHALLLISQ